MKVTKQVLSACLLAAALVCSPLPAARAAGGQIKALLCTGDYGMWAQDRVPLIENAVQSAAPGAVVWESEQSFNFVKKLEAPGYAQRFDVIVVGDVGMGQMTTKAQQALVDFVNGGGGLVYDLEGKSYIAFNGSPLAVPMPLAAILPYQYPDNDPQKNARPDAVAWKLDAPLFHGLDFSSSPLKAQAASPTPATLALERPQGKGRVLALYGVFGPSYKYVSYANFQKNPGGWDAWPGLGTLWARVLEREAQNSPVRSQSRADVDAAVKDAPLRVTATVAATQEIDDIRAADLSIVSLGQLYAEDGGTNEGLFLALNPRDWMDRQSQKALASKSGKAFPDKKALFDQYHIRGIYMADDTYGGYGGWNEAMYQTQIAQAVAEAKSYPTEIAFFQPGNEPPLDAGYNTFHNKIAQGVIAGAPGLKVIGPNTAFNIRGVDPAGMTAFLNTCGKTTDVLNWHIYACPPENVRAEALYWSQQAKGKMRSPGAPPVMFTESDAWNTEESQFNYLLDRAFVFLPTREIIGDFQYCMDPRTEGGTYSFGVLQPPGEFSANYNAYWLLRNLRGRMTRTTLAGAAPGALSHCHVLSSSADGGKTVTVVAYYDTGYYDSAAQARADKADLTVRVALPPGRYLLERSDVAWNSQKAIPVTGTAQKSAAVSAVLAPCSAVAWTWTRQ